MRRLIVTIVFTVFWSATVMAADPDGHYVVHGFGTSKCQSWVQYHKAVGEAFYLESGWVAGYLTAYNAYVWPSADVADGVQTDDYEAWMDTYCGTHPFDSLSNAANALVTELKNRKHP